MTRPSAKRILQTIPTVTSYHTFLKELTQALIRKGWEVHLACSLEPIKGFDCYQDRICGTAHDIAFPRGANPLKHLRAALHLRRIVARISPAVIHCHFGVTSFTASLARKRSWPHLIATVQGLTFPQTAGIGKYVFGTCEFWSQRRMDGTWVLSRCDLEAFARLGVREKIFLQHSSGFGCRLDIFTRSRFSEAYLGDLRSKLGVTKANFVFVFIGRQVHFKGFAVAVRAFAQILQEFPDARLLLVGERDPLHVTGLSKSEESWVKSCPKILSVGWVNDVSQFLRIANVNVFPSKREGMPVNLMESLAMGVPVITTDSRGCRDVVRDGVDGIMVPSASVEGIAVPMRRLISDRNLCQSLAKGAEAGRSRFDRDLWIAEQIEIYERLLANGACASAVSGLRSHRQNDQGSRGI